MRAAFPDVLISVQDQIAEGDKVVTRWTAQATQQGEFMGIPPTGKQVRVKAIHIHQIVDGNYPNQIFVFIDNRQRQQVVALHQNGTILLVGIGGYVNNIRIHNIGNDRFWIGHN